MALADATRAARLARLLGNEGILALLVFTRAQLLACLETHGSQLVIIDISLESSAPERLISELSRRTSAALMVMVDEDDPVLPHLDAGAHAVAATTTLDRTVVAQATALLGLSSGAAAAGPTHWGPVTVEPGTRSAFWNGHPVRLTPLQLRILSTLVMARGAVVTPEDLNRLVWRDGEVDGRDRVGAHIRRIRRVLRAAGGDDEAIVTVRGEGYCLRPQ